MTEETVETVEMVEAQCDLCDGSGLCPYPYTSGSNDLAAVCSQCGGSGKMTIKYTPFTGRKNKEGIKRVIEYSIPYLNAELVGEYGLSYQDWLDGKPFGPGTEVRGYTCPLSWYQLSANVTKLPDWDECIDLGQVVSRCKRWKSKAECWKRWDEENE